MTHEIRAPATGILSKILVKDGGSVDPGTVVCTENLIRVEDVMESPKLAE
jgi:biotin carboxyl carrier protein